MAALELLLSQARRHCFTRTPSPFSLLLRSNPSQIPSFLGFHRSLCSSSSPPDSSPEPNSEARPTRSPPPLQPVSYAVKPKAPSPSQEEPPQSTAPASPPKHADTVSAEAAAPTWTREDIRYVKDVPAITPVSYPSRVAPLPEDRAEAAAAAATTTTTDEKKEGESREEGNEQLESERKRIEAEKWRNIRPRRAVEEEKVPFPTLIKVDQKKGQKTIYDLKDAIRLVKANAKRNFNETVEAHVNLASELRRTDLKLSGSVKLPHNLGKAVKVVVFAEGTAADEARAAGADIVGGQELIEAIKNGNVKVDFDKCIATPKIMPLVGKEISKILRRLTPNPRSGTVTTDVARVVRETKENIDLRKDPSAIVHVGLGKVNFSEEALRENVGAFVNALLLAKPVGLKKSSKYAGYVNSFHLCSTMGPAFPVSIQSLSIAADHYNKLQLR